LTRPDPAPLLSQEDLLALLSRLGPEWAPPDFLDAVARDPQAGVYTRPENLALKFTLRSCQPPFSEPFAFGRIAAAQALGGLYAAGARPVAALALLDLPEPDIPSHMLLALKAGISHCCQDTGVALAGIHVQVTPTLSCGLLALGQINPRNLAHGSLPRLGDRLILGKPLGQGLYQAARARGELHPQDLQEWMALAAQPNSPGPALDCLDGVHQILEVGRQGLLGALQELEQAGTSLRLEVAAIPTMTRVRDLLNGLELRQQAQSLLRDPQFNGGLAVICSGETVTEVLSIFLQQGFIHASVIGQVVPAGPERLLLA